ncbi:MAG: hypothetical protein UV23_C0031G0010, partial [Candidatus Nomurabacteria bacterium GW2011_GWF1_42_40]
PEQSEEGELDVRIFLRGKKGADEDEDDNSGSNSGSGSN